MRTVFRLISSRRFFFLPVLTFLLLLVSLLILYPEGRSFFILNGLHFPAADYFFTYFTNAGDGIFAASVGVLLLLFYRYGAGLAFLIGFAVAGLVNAALKNFVFPDSPRPYIFFWRHPKAHYVEGVMPHLEYSFPSGHANTAFFVFTFIAMLRWKNNSTVQLLCALCACLAAWSRVYLGHHFVGDITAGAGIGMLSAILFFMLWRVWRNNSKLNSNLLQTLKK